MGIFFQDTDEVRLPPEDVRLSPHMRKRVSSLFLLPTLDGFNWVVPEIIQGVINVFLQWNPTVHVSCIG
jgi:hypothetical protein